MCIRNTKVTKGGGLTIRCTEWAYYPYSVRAYEFGAYMLFLFGVEESQTFTYIIVD